MAGIGGVATVIEGLSRAFLDDGKLSLEEIDAVFSKVEKRKEDETVAPAEEPVTTEEATS
jgi:hypothetical protein